jgi:hypothetical protein
MLDAGLFHARISGRSSQHVVEEVARVAAPRAGRAVVEPAGAGPVPVALDGLLAREATVAVLASQVFARTALRVAQHTVLRGIAPFVVMHGGVARRCARALCTRDTVCPQRHWLVGFRVQQRGAAPALVTVVDLDDPGDELGARVDELRVLPRALHRLQRQFDLWLRAIHGGNVLAHRHVAGAVGLAHESLDARIVVAGHGAGLLEAGGRCLHAPQGTHLANFKAVARLDPRSRTTGRAAGRALRRKEAVGARHAHVGARGCLLCRKGVEGAGYAFRAPRRVSVGARGTAETRGRAPAAVRAGRALGASDGGLAGIGARLAHRARRRHSRRVPAGSTGTARAPARQCKRAGVAVRAGRGIGHREFAGLTVNTRGGLCERVLAVPAHRALRRTQARVGARTAPYTSLLCLVQVFACLAKCTPATFGPPARFDKVL